MKWVNFFVSFLTLISVQSVYAIDFSRVNISWQYDPESVIKLNHRIIQEGETVTVFLRVSYTQDLDWEIQYLIQPKYESEFHDNLKDYTIDSLVTDTNRKVFKISFNKPEENLLVIKIIGDEGYYYYDVLLKNGAQPHAAIYPADGKGIPIFENYVNRSEYSFKAPGRILAMRYKEEFDLADSPMADMRPLAPSLLPDSSFWITEKSTLDDNYFYVLREDSGAVSGITIMKTSPYYPDQKLLVELALSMQYILNEAEKKELLGSTNLKESFNSFWLKTYNTQFRARNAIRNYFNWVEQANRFFTDFKQGWKTDRGMVYIIFGKPSEVYRLDNEEEWYYDNGPSFEYSTISTFFSPRTYSLRRNIDYEESWFRFIASIRRGSE